MQHSHHTAAEGNVRTRRGVLLLAALCALGPLGVPAVAAAAAWAAPAAGLTPEPGGVVRAVAEDGTFVLDDGRRVRLAAIRLPSFADLPPDASAEERAGVAAHANAALTWIRTHALGRIVALWTPDVARDRYGRILAQVVTDEQGAGWLQGGLIDAGLARVATMPGAAAGAGALLQREARARVAARALWRDPLYRPRTPGETWPWLGTFQIVRGAVRVTAKVRSRVYLNFGDDWRRDFTILVERPGRAGFRDADLLDLRDQFIQVRGWLFPSNGPMIALDHPAALETRVIL